MIKCLLVISIEIVVIFIITHWKDIKINTNFLKEKVKLKHIIMIILSIIICLILVFKLCYEIKNYKIEQEIVDEQKKLTENQEKEEKFYNIAVNKEYLEQNPTNPYIPKDFEYVEGEWNTGFVIQDKYQNQYVWVPCTNKEIDIIPKLNRTDLNFNPWISKNLCYDTDYEQFIDSALKYGGFYIGRYEIGKENGNKPVIKEKSEIWTNIDKESAIKVISEMNMNYEKDIKIKLINSYAYDTVCEWIIMNLEDKKIEYTETEEDSLGKRYSGVTKYNNIYDLFDTTYELTTEIYSGNITVCRGKTIKISEIENEVHKEKIDNRISFIFEKSNNIGIRTVLYLE